jgi:hypothetical protein
MKEISEIENLITGAEAKLSASLATYQHQHAEISHTAEAEKMKINPKIRALAEIRHKLSALAQRRDNLLAMITNGQKQIAQQQQAVDEFERLVAGHFGQALTQPTDLIILFQHRPDLAHAPFILKKFQQQLEAKKSELATAEAEILEFSKSVQIPSPD